ncbi:hypothetical protein [Halovivax gelatinilyticus]|uniref:hypothetical protein n=1 Tax=Halovivax gelatinilyticus TaxID=2961597 RepID=UPI0020CA3075|nr:hypothetical protein [Halovivax gelatinilyticus]
MDVSASATDPVIEGTPPEELVSCHQTRPGRFVFTERNNVDGWIATDVSVSLQP